ncbi:hypothetical protein ACWGRF_08680 [Streptomyces zhihengii]
MTVSGTFEIRVICPPDVADDVAATLAQAFTVGPVRRYPTRDRSQVRLYLTATDRAPAPVLRLIRTDR